MADEAAEVKLGADTKPASDAMQAAAQSIAASLQNMSEKLNNFGRTNKTVSSEAIKNNADLSRSFLEMKESIKGGFDAIVGVMERFRGVMAGLALAIGGGALFKESIKALLDEEQAVLNLENVLGLASDKATELAVALKLAGSSSEAYTQTALHMGRVLKTQEEDFKAIGVQTRDAAGNFLPLETIMQNSFTTLQEYKSGTDQAEVAMRLFGRSVAGVYDLMVRLPEATKRAKELVAQLGIEMGPERQAQIEAYRLEVNAVKVMFEELEQKIGEAVLPRMEAMAVWIGEHGPAAMQVLSVAIQGVMTVFETLGATVATIVIYASAKIENFATTAVAAWQVIKEAASGNFGAIPGIVAAANAKIEANSKAAAESVVATWTDARAKIAKLWSDDKHESVPGHGPLGSGGKTAPAMAKGTTGDASEMAGWEAVLKSSESGYNNLKLQQGSFEVWSVEMTRDYWQQVLDFATLSAKDRQAVENKFYDAERQVQQKAFAAHIAALETDMAAFKYNYDAQIAIAQQAYDEIAQRYGKESAQAEAALKRIVELRQKAADQQIRIEDAKEKAIAMLADGQYAAAKANVDQQVAMRQLGVQQSLAIERNYLDQKYAIDKAAVQRDQAANIDNPVKFQELKNKELAIDIAYQNQRTAIDNKAELDRAAVAIQAADDVQNAFGTFLSDIATHTKTVSQAFKDMAKSILDDFAKIYANQIAKQLLGAGTEGGGILNSITGALFGGGGAAGAAGSGQLAAAGTTLLGAGTALDASAAALTSAAGSLAAASFGSAAGGMGSGIGSLFSDILTGVAMFDQGSPYIPRDQLAIVHRGEAVIPAKYNNGSVGGYGVGAVHNTFMLSGPIDAKTQHQIAIASFKGTRQAMRRA